MNFCIWTIYIGKMTLFKTFFKNTVSCANFLFSRYSAIKAAIKTVGYVGIGSELRYLDVLYRYNYLF